MTTYHAKTGKFCNADAAHTVVKGGERYKVVRQHRRVNIPKPVIDPAVEQELPSSKWIPLAEVLAKYGVQRRV